jgi:hypothetical protein
MPSYRDGNILWPDLLLTAFEWVPKTPGGNRDDY